MEFTLPSQLGDDSEPVAHWWTAWTSDGKIRQRFLKNLHKILDIPEEEEKMLIFIKTIKTYSQYVIKYKKFNHE